MKLDPAELQPLLARIEGWQHRDERGGVLTREFRFADFAQAFGFMAQVALWAERWDHHPEWSNVYNRVTVTLTTHDASGLTRKDIEMAALMNRIADGLASQPRADRGLGAG